MSTKNSLSLGSPVKVLHRAHPTHPVHGILREGLELRVGGFKDQGPWFRVQGLELRMWDSGFRVEGQGLRIHSLGLRVQSSGIRDSGVGSISYSL